MIYYPLVRFFLEFLRTDSWFFPGTPFNVVHLLSVLSIVTASTILIVRHRKPVAVEADEDTPGVGSGEADEVDDGEMSESSAEAADVETGEAAQEEVEVEPKTVEAGEVKETVPRMNDAEEYDEEGDTEKLSSRADV